MVRSIPRKSARVAHAALLRARGEGGGVYHGGWLEPAEKSLFVKYTVENELWHTWWHTWLQPR